MREINEKAKQTNSLEGILSKYKSICTNNEAKDLLNSVEFEMKAVLETSRVSYNPDSRLIDLESIEELNYELLCRLSSGEDTLDDFIFPSCGDSVQEATQMVIGDLAHLIKELTLERNMLRDQQQAAERSKKRIPGFIISTDNELYIEHCSNADLLIEGQEVRHLMGEHVSFISDKYLPEQGSREKQYVSGEKVQLEIDGKKSIYLLYTKPIWGAKKSRKGVEFHFIETKEQPVEESIIDSEVEMLTDHEHGIISNLMSSFNDSMDLVEMLPHSRMQVKTIGDKLRNLIGKQVRLGSELLSLVKDLTSKTRLVKNSGQEYLKLDAGQLTSIVEFKSEKAEKLGDPNWNTSNGG